MRAAACVTALVCLAALLAWAATADERRSELPLVQPAEPSARGAAVTRPETSREAPVEAVLPALVDDDSTVPGSLVLAFVLANVLFLGGAAVLLLSAKAHGPVTASGAHPAPARPRVAVAGSGRPPRPREDALVSTAATDRIEVCEIALRPGGVSSRFFAGPVGGAAFPGLPLAVSPPFGLAPGSTVDESEDARNALDELVRALTAAGWEPFAAGEQRFERRFRRT